MGRRASDDLRRLQYLAELEADLHRAKMDVQTLREMVRELKADLVSRDTEISALDKLLAETQADLAKSEAENERLALAALRATAERSSTGPQSISDWPGAKT